MKELKAPELFATITKVQKKETFAMLFCVLCWSTSGLFIKLIDWNPLVISCARSAVAAFFMALVHGKAMFAAQKAAAPRLFGINALAVASAASAVTKILYVTANKLTSPANAVLLQHTAPVWAALAAGALIGERLRPAQWFAVFAAVGGAALFFLDGLTSGNLAGDGVALLCGITFAFSMIAMRSLKENSPALALFYSHLIPVIIGLPFIFIAPPVLTAVNVLCVIFLGLVQAGVASLLYAYAIKRLQAIRVMFIAQLEPLLNPLWVFAFTAALPTRYALLGGGIIIAAVLAANIGGRKTV